MRFPAHSPKLKEGAAGLLFTSVTSKGYAIYKIITNWLAIFYFSRPLNFKINLKTYIQTYFDKFIFHEIIISFNVTYY